MAKLEQFISKKSLGAATIAIFTVLSLSACGTTSTGSSANAAPITYKLDQAAVHTAAVVTNPYQTYTPVTRPAQPPAPVVSAPVYQAPVYTVPSAPVAPALPVPPKSSFDQGTVDKELYAHQRIGNTYSILGKSYSPKHQPNYNETGIASWYGDKFHGKPTASGELYDMNDITAAHKTLPLNSMVYVTNLETGKGLKVRVNDRGPFVDGRIIDLSRATAQALGLFSSGLAKVRVQYAGPADPMAAGSVALPSPMPVRPEPEAAPEMVVETPNYTPLRDLGVQPTTPAPTPMTVPQQQYPFQPAAPYTPVQGDDWRNATPPAVQPSVPQSVGVPQGDEPVTLTITGPVHMASDKADGETPEAIFIPAVNYSTLPPTE